MDGQSVLFTSLGGVIIAVVSFVMGNSRNESRARCRIYQRIDEEREEATKTYVRQDICQVIHKQVDTRLEKIEKQTECIPEIKAGIDLLLKKNGLNNNG